MTEKKLICNIGFCGSNQVRTRGLCGSHYVALMNKVKKGQTTWDKLEKAGISKPKQTGKKTLPTRLDEYLKEKGAM